MKKKVLSLILAVALVASMCCILAACGDEKTNTAETTSPVASANDAGNAVVSSNADTDNGGNQGGEASSADAEEIETPEATSAEYTGDTVITFEQAAEFVFAKYSYGEGYTAEDGGAIIIPDGSVWHNVLVVDENGEMVASYYVSDTTGDVKTTSEMEAYAYR